MPPGSCDYGHYWPGLCQQCDTAWHATFFTCGIYGHDYDDYDGQCNHCTEYDCDPDPQSIIDTDLAADHCNPTNGFCYQDGCPSCASVIH